MESSASIPVGKDSGTISASSGTGWDCCLVSCSLWALCRCTFYPFVESPFRGWISLCLPLWRWNPSWCSERCDNSKVFLYSSLTILGAGVAVCAALSSHWAFCAADQQNHGRRFGFADIGSCDACELQSVFFCTIQTRRSSWQWKCCFSGVWQV